MDRVGGCMESVTGVVIAANVMTTILSKFIAEFE